MHQKFPAFFLYDSPFREKEVDLCIPASEITPEAIAFLRKTAGGLICVAIEKEICKKLKLPFLVDIIKASKLVPCKVYHRTNYRDKPAFSISINHFSVRTGITDIDRAKTIRRLVEIVEEKEFSLFSKEFFTPGHVSLLVSRGIDKRRGHTELSIEVCKKKGFLPICVICEVLDDKTHRAMTISKIKKLSRSLGIETIEGDDLP